MVESGADDDLAPNSYLTYERHCRVNIIPVLGGKVLKSLGLGSLDVDDALLRWRAMPKDKGDGTLGKRSVFNIFATLRTALNQAVEWGKLAKNPCTRKVKRGKSQPSANTEEDLAVLLASLREHHLFVPSLFLATTAVRRTEMLALTRNMIDLDAGLAIICRAQTKLLDGQLAFKANKTDRVRTVTLSPILVDALRRHLAENPGDLVFPHPVNGGHWHFSTFSTALRDAGASAGITTSAQRLRRLFSSELADPSGAGDRTISTIMGNSPEVISRHYNAREVAKMRQVTDFVGARVTTLVTKPDPVSAKPL